MDKRGESVSFTLHFIHFIAWNPSYGLVKQIGFQNRGRERRKRKGERASNSLMQECVLVIFLAVKKKNCFSYPRVVTHGILFGTNTYSLFTTYFLLSV